MSGAHTIRREYPVRPFVSSSLAACRDGRFLVAARVQPPFEYAYSLPGGMVETGETGVETAVRELMEEVGIEVRDPLFLDLMETICPDAMGRVRYHYVTMIHAAFWKSGEAKTGPEASDIRWVTPEEADKLPTTPRLKEMLLRARIILGGQPAGTIS